MRRAIEKHQLLEKYGRVLVGVSGGKDSYALLDMLVQYNERYCQRWEIHAAHIDPQFPGWDPDPIRQFVERLDLPFHYYRSTIATRIRELGHRCFFCSRERRRRLLEIAEAHNIFTVALAHHQEDVGETLLLNMLYNGEIATCLPRQSVIHGRFHFIRPLYYYSKDDILDLDRVRRFPRDVNLCPYGKDSQREKIRAILAEIRQHNRAVDKNLFGTLFNIKREYLP